MSAGNRQVFEDSGVSEGYTVAEREQARLQKQRGVMMHNIKGPFQPKFGMSRPC